MRSYLFLGGPAFGKAIEVPDGATEWIFDHQRYVRFEMKEGGYVAVLFVLPGMSEADTKKMYQQVLDGNWSNDSLDLGLGTAIMSVEISATTTTCSSSAKIDVVAASQAIRDFTDLCRKRDQEALKILAPALNLSEETLATCITPYCTIQDISKAVLEITENLHKNRAVLGGNEGFKLAFKLAMEQVVKAIQTASLTGLELTISNVFQLEPIKFKAAIIDEIKFEHEPLRHIRVDQIIMV